MPSEEEYACFLNEIFDLKACFSYTKKQGLLTVQEKLERLAVCRSYLNVLTPGWESLKVFHVAGSSGKGSTALFLASILATRYSVGTLLSPHIFDVTERILINLEEISRAELMKFWETKLRPAVVARAHEEAFVLSLPEIMLVTAVHSFMKREVEYVVLESGLGGRYDQTNIFRPLASLITTISLDHTHILGSTIKDIAYEKGGIIKPGIPLFTTEQKEEALEIFKTICEQEHARFHHVSPGSLPFPLKLPGVLDTLHNRMNASLAAAALLHVLEATEKGVNTGLARTRLKGRFEQRGNTIIDIAHNEAEISALISALEIKHPLKKKILVIGMADKKRHREMLEPLGKMVETGTLDAIFFARAGYRGISPETLVDIARSIPGLHGVRIETFDSAAAAYQEARRGAEGDKEELVVVTGSTFFVDAVFNPSKRIKDVNMGAGR